MHTNVTVIIRSVGERTESLCRSLVSQQVPEDSIAVVREAPFSAALVESFQVGIKRGLPWTLCLDADILLRPDAIEDLLHAAQGIEDNVCEIQGLVLDKFFGGPRVGGPHLYRTSLLPRVLDLIPKAGCDLRPETYALEQMKGLGNPWRQIPIVLGLHDFEQYYRDIFRKSFVQAHKHPDFTHLFVKYWRRMAVKDNDYQVALWGLAAGIAQVNDVRIDVRQTLSDAAECLSRHGWEEKPCISEDELSAERIERIIAEFDEAEEYKLLFPKRFGLAAGEEKSRAPNASGLHDAGKPESRRQKLLDLRERVGVLRLIPWLFGWSLTRLGNKIRRLSERVS